MGQPCCSRADSGGDESLDDVPISATGAKSQSKGHRTLHVPSPNKEIDTSSFPVGKSALAMCCCETEKIPTFGNGLEAVFVETTSEKASTAGKRVGRGTFWEGFSPSGPSRGSDCLHSQYKVTLERQGNAAVAEKLGLRLAFNEAALTLPIIGITGGLAERWNAHCSVDLQFREGDIIVEVNGLRGDSTKMLDRCSKDRTLSLIVEKSRGGQADTTQERYDELQQQICGGNCSMCVRAT